MPSTNLTPDDVACKMQADSDLKQALSFLKQKDWKTEKSSGADIVQSLCTPTTKIFCVQAIVNLSAADLFHKVIDNCEDFTWNTTIRFLKRLRVIDNNSDVVHVVSNEGAGGLISCRDFINARIWYQEGNSYVIGFSSTSKFSVPVMNGLVRAEQGPSAYICTQTPDNPSTCKLQYLLSVSLKGWLPQYVVDQAMPGVLLDYIGAIRKMGAARLNSKET